MNGKFIGVCVMPSHGLISLIVDNSLHLSYADVACSISRYFKRAIYLVSKRESIKHVDFFHVYLEIHPDPPKKTLCFNRRHNKEK